MLGSPTVRGYAAINGSGSFVSMEESAETAAKQRELLDKRQLSLEIAYAELE